jgi:hypothetical protein
MTEPRDVAELLYGSDESLRSDYGPSLVGSTDLLTDLAGWTEEQRDEHLRNATRVFHDAGIRADAASSLHALLAQHVRAPAADETIQQWEVESRRQLRERYRERGGIAEANRRMTLVREYLADHPAIAKMLKDSGVGSHPKFVTELADRALDLRRKK